MSTVYRFGVDATQEYTSTRIGENDYFIRLHWNQRTADWRISIQNTNTQDWLCVERRLTPNSPVTPFPDGQMFCEGPEQYNLEDLGDRLIVRFYTKQELEDYLKLITISEDPTPRLF